MRRGGLVLLVLWPLGPWLFTGTRQRARSAGSARRVQRNPYEVLGLQGGSSYDDIRAAFRKLARTYHPDVPGTGDEDRFRSIREALEELETPAGRARWSTSRSSAKTSAGSSYSYGAGYGAGASYTSDFGGYGYGYERAEYYETYEPREREQRSRYDRKRQTEREQRAREREWRRQAKKEEAKKARGDPDVIMEKELKKAVREAEFRQVQRKKDWKRDLQGAKDRLKKEVQQEMQSAWNVLHQFQDSQKDHGREQAEKWKEKLEAARDAAAKQRKEDGEMWVQKFAEVKQQAADGREDLGRRFAEKWRDFRHAQAQEAKAPRQVVSPEKINEEIEELLQRQDERISQCWQDMYKGMMKSVQRSINNEPKLWKDRFRSAMIQLGRGSEGLQKRWRGLFQDTMRDMGEQEMKEVAEWVAKFKSSRPWTDKELAKRAKLTQASRKLKAMDYNSQLLKTINQCRQAEIQRLKYQAWDRGQYMKKFRQEQDRLWKSQQAEELRMTEEFWQAVKESVLPQDVQAEPKTR